jgi:signal transduction histidine kinase
MILHKIWETISEFGIDYQQGERNKFRAKLLNRLIFIALCASVVMFVLQVIIYFSFPIVTLTNVAFEIFLLWLCYLGRMNWALHLMFFIFPLRSVIVSATVNGGTGEHSILMAIGFCGLIFYENKKWFQIGAVLYVSLLYACFKFYLQSVGIVGNNGIFFDVITFPIVLIAMYIIVTTYQSQISFYEQNKLKLIQDLENKNQELEQFTYIASHDLKTPLRNVSSHLDLIQRYIAQERFDKIDVSINFAKKGVKQMYALLNDILEFKNIAAQAQSDETTSLKAVVTRIKNSISHRVKLTFSDLPTLNMRDHDVDILFQNIIRNAIIYNQSPQPEINIKYELTHKTIKISILDNGIGIDPKYHELIFHFFKRLHNEDNHEGTGIGLGLCRKIARNYGGDIAVISPLPQGGSCFVITLPVALLKSS